MEALYDLKDILCDQVEEVVKKGNDISPSEVEMMYKVIDIIKDIVTIEAMENADDYSYDYMNEAGSSRRYSRDGRRGRDGDSDGRYSERSYRRMMSRDNYSRHDEKDYLKQQISELQRKLESL